MEIHKNGLFIEEKEIKDKCGNCKKRLFLQVYHFKGGLRRVISCKNCNSYTAMKKAKKYITDMKEIRKPSFLKKE